jgi:hypothetical protein
MQIDLPHIQNDPKLPALIETIEKRRAEDSDLDALFVEQGWTNRAYALGTIIEIDLERRENDAESA